MTIFHRIITSKHAIHTTISNQLQTKSKKVNDHIFN